MGYVEQYNFSEKLKIHWSAGLPLVDVQIAGKTYRFLFDTGAPTVIPSELVSELNLKLLDVEQIFDAAGGKLEKQIFRLPSLVVGGIEFAEFPVMTSDFKQNLSSSCIGFDGILGYSMLKRVIVLMNLDADEVILTDKLPQLSGYAETSVKFDKQLLPKVAVNFSFGGGWFGLDTGSNAAMTIGNPSVIPKFKSEGYAYRITYGAGSVTYSGLGENRESYTFTLEDFSIGNNIPIESSYAKVEQSGAALIGIPLLSQFSVVIDFPGERAFFKPSSPRPISVAEETDFGFRPFWSVDSGLFVSAIESDSPASNSEMELGDLIVSMNSVDTSAYTKNDFCKLLRDMGSRQSLFETQNRLNVKLRTDSGDLKEVFLEK